MALEWVDASRLVVVVVTVDVVLMPVLAMLQIVAIMELSLLVALKAFLYHSIRMALEWVAAFLLAVAVAAVVVVLMPVLAMIQGGVAVCQATVLTESQSVVLTESQSVVLALECAIWL